MTRSRKHSLLLSAALGVLALTGCREGFDYEYAVNNDFFQIGCAGHLTGKEPPKTPPESGSFFRLGLPWWISEDGRPVYGLALSLLADADTFGKGVAVAPLLAREKMTGVVCGLLVVANEVRGVSVACLNFIGGRCHLQIGVLNVAEILYTQGYVDVQLGLANGGGGVGVQIAPLFNQSDERSRFQLGLVNWVESEKEKHRGCQIGAVNIATGGFQLGLVNINEKPTLFKVFPLVNF